MGGVIGEKQSDDLFLIQIRLFRLAQNKWNIDEQKCSEIFGELK